MKPTFGCQQPSPSNSADRAGLRGRLPPRCTRRGQAQIRHADGGRERARRYKSSLQIRARLVWQLAGWRTAHHRTVRGEGSG